MPFFCNMPFISISQPSSKRASTFSPNPNLFFSLRQRKELKETSTPSKVFFSVHFSHAREKEPKSALPPRPPSKGDATAPPVALTLRYPRPITGSGWSVYRLARNACDPLGPAMYFLAGATSYWYFNSSFSRPALLKSRTAFLTEKTI